MVNKGELPIGMIIVIAIAILILFVLAFFFSTKVTDAMSDAQASQIFYDECNDICGSTKVTGSEDIAKLCSAINQDDSIGNFLKACKTLKYIDNVNDNQQCLVCFKQCGSCAMSGSYLELKSGEEKYLILGSYFVG